jgi:hypothetical protein
MIKRLIRKLFDKGHVYDYDTWKCKKCDHEYSHFINEWCKGGSRQ